MLDTNINSKHTVYYIIPIAISFRFLWLYDGCKWNTLVRWQCRLSLGWSIIIIQTRQWKVHDLSLEVCLTDGRMYTRLFCQTIYRIAGPYFSSSTFVAALGLFIEAWSLLCLSSASASAMRVLIETARGNDSGVFLYSFYAYQIFVWKIRLFYTKRNWPRVWSWGRWRWGQTAFPLIGFHNRNGLRGCRNPCDPVMTRTRIMIIACYILCLGTDYTYSLEILWPKGGGECDLSCYRRITLCTGHKMSVLICITMYCTVITYAVFTCLFFCWISSSLAMISLRLLLPAVLLHVRQVKIVHFM